MKKILPINTNPECITYHNTAFPLGIIKAHLSNYYEWLAEKAINCNYNSKEQLFRLYENDFWGECQNIADTQMIVISPHILWSEALDLIEYIKYLIDFNFYIVGTYNEFYIPQKRAYKKYNFEHDYLLFGYDDEDGSFMSIGYTDTGKYSRFKINYSDYIDSIKNSCKTRVYFWFHKIYKDYYEDFNPKKIVAEIKKYFSNKNDDSVNEGTIIGIQVWDELEKYILYTEKTKIDLRNIRVFMEHKLLMNNRLMVLKNNDIINESFVEEYKEKIYNKAQVVFNLAIKNLLGSDCLNETISSIINDITKEEEHLFSFF